MASRVHKVVVRDGQQVPQHVLDLEAKVRKLVDSMDNQDQEQRIESGEVIARLIVQHQIQHLDKIPIDAIRLRANQASTTREFLGQLWGGWYDGLESILSAIQEDVSPANSVAGAIINIVKDLDKN